MPLKKIEQNVLKEYHTWKVENMSEIFAKVNPDEDQFPNYPVNETHYFSTEFQGHAVDWYVTLNFCEDQLQGGFMIDFDAIKKLEPKNHVTCNFYLIDADKNKFFLGRKNRKFYESPKSYFPTVHTSCLPYPELPNTIDKLLPNDTMTLYIELITYLDGDPIFPDENMISTYYPDPSLSDDFSELYKVQDDRDVMIYVQGVAFPVHKRVLRARCPKLYEMVDYHQQISDGNDNPVALTGIEPEIFKRVLEFMYTRNVEDLDDHAVGLLEAASKYELIRLKNLCEESLASYYCTFENSEEIKSLAAKCGAEQLFWTTDCLQQKHAEKKKNCFLFNNTVYKELSLLQSGLSLHH
ncbi:TD and POZ domain-containing protein 1-like [Microplitis mediator]|uniref:TD and POZ domain-containing protein 1-like n=1 Tax=Microplitis mediator TaxID=375433 RepID=UPI002557A23B|nr:TD and POZ domain-containing protein 1-like [Microplitis mediator]